MKNMILSAKKVSGFSSTNSSESLGEYLREIVDKSLTHRILYDNENETIKAISFHGPDWLPKNITANQLQFNVAVSKVTFGPTCPKSGISKWSFITLLTPGHEAFVVVAFSITHEDADTFIYPSLRYDNWVLSKSN